MNIVHKKRAKDKEIEHITAISLDIDPIRPKGTPATERAHQTAIQFAVKLQKDLGGGVDDSGNGAYLWIQFAKPITMTGENRDVIKQKCRQWQKLIATRISENCTVSSTPTVTRRLDCVAPLILEVCSSNSKALSHPMTSNSFGTSVAA